MRCRHTDHTDMFTVIDEIYVFAVDKKIDENIRVDQDYKIPIQEELLGLFETYYLFRNTYDDDDLSQNVEDCGESLQEEDNEGSDDN